MDEGLGVELEELLGGDGPFEPEWFVHPAGPAGCGGYPPIVWERLRVCSHAEEAAAVLAAFREPVTYQDYVEFGGEDTLAAQLARLREALREVGAAVLAELRRWAR